MGHWHTTSTLVRSAQNGISRREHPHPAAFHPEEWKALLGIINSLIKIHRELTRNK
jgi:hypothetical protein